MMGDGLFFVSQTGKKISGAVMAGWDGHRGWIYSLAVHPNSEIEESGEHW
jgi:ribosomal protein S18 acetylase RimI-like enzyme